MKQSVTRPAGFASAFPVEGSSERIRATRLRLHMPRQRARDELRAWDDGEAFFDGREAEIRRPPRRHEPR